MRKPCGHWKQALPQTFLKGGVLGGGLLVARMVVQVVIHVLRCVRYGAARLCVLCERSAHSCAFATGQFRGLEYVLVGGCIFHERVFIFEDS